jgi:hypothetical protein
MKICPNTMSFYTPIRITDKLSKSKLIEVIHEYSERVENCFSVICKLHLFTSKNLLSLFATKLIFCEKSKLIIAANVMREIREKSLSF